MPSPWSTPRKEAGLKTPYKIWGTLVAALFLWWHLPLSLSETLTQLIHAPGGQNKLALINPAQAATPPL